MLNRLWLDPFFSANDQHNKINAGNTCNHRFDKPLMSRDINDTAANLICQLQLSKPQLNGDASPLFFL
jgi:hypothetical protein